MENNNIIEDDIRQFKSNFYKNYHEVLVPAIEGFEDERKRKLICATVYSILLITAGVLELMFEFKFGSEVDGRLGGLLITFGVCMYHMMKKNFEHKIKRKIMSTVASCFGKMNWSLSYPKCRSEHFVNAGLFKEFTSCKIDDVFTGEYKNVNLEVIEGKYVYGSGRNESTVFKGVLIVLDMNKNFSGHTLLWEDSIFHKSPVAGLRHTELEDVNFEKRFDVFTNDEIEARYILTPAFMERLTNIRMAFHCKAVRCAFYNNRLFIGMPTGLTQDLFSICSLVKPVTDTKQFEDLCTQFVSILELIDHLKLDKKAML